MKVLSLTQPWASLMALDEMRVETRSWSTRHRGELAIAAAKGFPRDCRELCFQSPFVDVLERHGIRGDALPRGAILAVVELVDVRPSTEMRAAIERSTYRVAEHELAFGDYGEGRFGWLTRNVRRLPEPVPARGRLGLWTAPPEVETAVRAQLLKR